MTELRTQIKTQLAEFKPFEANLKKFHDTYDEMVYDLDDAKNNRQARSDSYAIGKVVSKLDAKHKEIKAPLSELVKLIDCKRKEIKDDLQCVQSKIKTQIQKHEAKQAEHEAVLKEKFDAIGELLVDDLFGMYANDYSKKLDVAKKIVVDELFEHYQKDAEILLKSVIGKLTERHAAAIKSESEAAELEKLRKEAAERKQKEHEAHIAAQAAEQSQIAAENKAKAQIEASEQARREAIRREERAKLEAEESQRRAVQEERQRIERERSEQDAQDKAKQDAENLKKSKQAHRTKILTAVKKSFLNAGFKESDAVKIVELLRDNKVSNAQINY